jgi:hypothetical protein
VNRGGLTFLFSLPSCSLLCLSWSSSKNLVPLTRKGSPRSLSHSEIDLCRSASSCGAAFSTKDAQNEAEKGRTDLWLLLLYPFPRLLLT